MFKNTADWLLLTHFVVSCISHASDSGKVLSKNFLWKLFFKLIKTAASEITEKQPVIFNTVQGFQTLSYILLWIF